jgi:hypothetical protein
MTNALLCTTSTQGLQPLGSPAQRSYELVSGTLRQRLGPDHAALFGEPVTNEAGDQIDWHAPVAGRAVPMADLPEADQQALRDKLGGLVGDISQEAEVLGQSEAGEDQRLSEALSNAIEIPDEAMIYAVKGTDGTYQPVLVHWGWVRNEQAAVRGILTGMVPRVGAPVGVAPVAQRQSPLWWWLILLGWLLLAALLTAILYVLVAPCGVNRFGLVFCPGEQAASADPFEENRVIGDEIARLQRELAMADRSCQPRIPILPAPPDTPDTPAIPVFPKPTEPDVPAPAAPEPPPAPPDETKSDADRAEVQERIAERGAELGALNFVLEWDSIDDIDLFVTCPAGDTLSYSKRAGCGGRYDLDANVAAASAVRDPAENIVFENAATGLYKVRAQLRDDRTGTDQTVTLHVLRKSGPSQSYTGIVGPGREDWTLNISISR